jgi:putative hemolysin
MRIALASTALALTLAACAASPGQDRYTSEFDKLSADCQARGGILAPTSQQTGRPQTDNVCELRNGGGRIPNR